MGFTNRMVLASRSRETSARSAFSSALAIEDGHAVLAAAVHELTAAVGGVHMPPENIQQLVVGDFIRVVDDFHGLDVARAAGRHLVVSGVFHLAAGVSRYRFHDAVDFLELRFRAPETTAGENRRSGWSIDSFIMGFSMGVSIFFSMPLT